MLSIGRAILVALTLTLSTYYLVDEILGTLDSFRHSNSLMPFETDVNEIRKDRILKGPYFSEIIRDKLKERIKQHLTKRNLTTMKYKFNHEIGAGSILEVEFDKEKNVVFAITMSQLDRNIIAEQKSNKTSENKTSENKTSENKTSENKTSENKTSENKTPENKTNSPPEITFRLQEFNLGPLLEDSSHFTVFMGKSGSSFMLGWNALFEDKFNGTIVKYGLSKDLIAIQYTTRNNYEKDLKTFKNAYFLRIYKIDGKKTRVIVDDELEIDRSFDSISIHNRTIFCNLRNDIYYYRTFKVPTLEQLKNATEKVSLSRGENGPLRKNLVQFQIGSSLSLIKKHPYSPIDFVYTEMAVINGATHFTLETIEQNENQTDHVVKKILGIDFKTAFSAKPYSFLPSEKLFFDAPQSYSFQAMYFEEIMMFAVLGNDKRSLAFKLRLQPEKVTFFTVSEDMKLAALYSSETRVVYLYSISRSHTTDKHGFFGLRANKRIKIDTKFDSMALRSVKLVENKFSFRKLNSKIKKEFSLLLIFDQGVVAVYSIRQLFEFIDLSVLKVAKLHRKEMIWGMLPMAIILLIRLIYHLILTLHFRRRENLARQNERNLIRNNNNNNAEILAIENNNDQNLARNNNNNAEILAIENNNEQNLARDNNNNNTAEILAIENNNEQNLARDNNNERNLANNDEHNLALMQLNAAMEVIESTESSEESEESESETSVESVSESSDGQIRRRVH